MERRRRLKMAWREDGLPNSYRPFFGMMLDMSGVYKIIPGASWRVENANFSLGFALRCEKEFFESQSHKKIWVESGQLICSKIGQLMCS